MFEPEVVVQPGRIMLLDDEDVSFIRFPSFGLGRLAKSTLRVVLIKRAGSRGHT